MNDLLQRICDAYVQGKISEKHFLVLIKQITVSTMRPNDDDHECDDDGESDTGICRDCRDHCSNCSICGLSGCCGAPEWSLD
jgi:hypothetical protein